jgi:hypothetical protein
MRIYLKQDVVIRSEPHWLQANHGQPLDEVYWSRRSVEPGELIGRTVGRICPWDAEEMTARPGQGCSRRAAVT